MKVEGKEFKPGSARFDRLPFMSQSTHSRYTEMYAILEKYGIANESFDTKTSPMETLMDAPLDTVRLIYSLSLPYEYEEFMGSIGFSLHTATENKRLTDGINSKYRVSLKKGQEFWGIHHMPFGRDRRDLGLTLESMYLGSLDLKRIIENDKDMPHKPSVIIGDGNIEATNFAINKLGFHLAEAQITTPYTDYSYKIKGKQTYEFLKKCYLASQKCIKAEKKDMQYIVPAGQIRFLTFTKTDDFFSNNNMIQNLDETRQLLFSRAAKLNRTQAKNEEEYEKELRIIGIKKNFGALINNHQLFVMQGLAGGPSSIPMYNGPIFHTGAVTEESQLGRVSHKKPEDILGFILLSSTT